MINDFLIGLTLMILKDFCFWHFEKKLVSLKVSA